MNHLRKWKKHLEWNSPDTGCNPQPPAHQSPAQPEPHNPYNVSQMSHQFGAGNPAGCIIPGAVGDGVADDTAALQRALDIAPPGSLFSLPSGLTFRITAPLILSRPLILQGDCTLACAFRNRTWDHCRCDNYDTWKQFLFVVRANNVTISGIRFANTTPYEGIAGVMVEGSNFVFQQCIVSDFSQGLMIGRIKLANVAPATYSNINIQKNQFLNIRGVEGGSECYGDGIVIFGCEGVVIHQNSLSAAQGRTPRNGINVGPESYTQSHTVTISKNHVLGDWDYPITTEGARNCVIETNSVEGCCVCGIIERGQEITVRGNILNISPRANHGCPSGIEFYGVDNGLIQSNVISGRSKHGIICRPSHETKGSNNIQIVDNTVEGDFFYGVYIGNSDKTEVHRNKLLLLECQEKGNVGVVGWYTQNLTCYENSVNTTFGTGFIFTGCSNVEMCRNQLCTSRAGVYVARECKNVNVCENNFSACKETKFDSHPDVKSSLWLQGNTM